MRRLSSALGAIAILAAIGCLIPAAALARKPIISYLEFGVLKLYDAETNTDTPLPIATATPNQFDHGISHNGRYVVYTDANQKIHLLDRQASQEVSLPGIDIYPNPGFLSVSDFGVIAFDNNANGPAAVYNSATKVFVPAGFPANSGHRQTQLSSGGLLVTTCMATCVTDKGNTAPYAQNLATGLPFNLPDDADSDEEDPCAAGNRPVVGWHMGVPNAAGQKDVFIFDVLNQFLIPLPGLNHAVDDDTFCVLDNAADYIGLQRENLDVLQLYERASGSFIPLPPRVLAPSNRGNALFSMPPCAGRYATLMGSAGPEKLTGTSGPDVILALEGNDKVNGGKGRDIICGGDGRDKIKGGPGKDKLLGEQGRDKIKGGPGKDKLIGGKGKDRLIGGKGKDKLRGGKGRDVETQ